ncbi:MAG: hypothetical protein E6R07_05750 [Nevskiaceae bacterium]|nr:MAG: hypothetical protein E6R07_05750 [Nevskiaceae bacterium]
MSQVLLSLSAILPLLAGLVLSLPLFLLLRRLWRTRSLRIRLRRIGLLNRHWQPVFLERYDPRDGH